MKKANKFLIPIILSTVLLLSITGCNSKESPNLQPILTTTTVSNITETSAKCGGTISSDGGSSVTARGVCWATTNNPTIIDSKTSDGTGSGSFVSTMNNLTSGTSYYVRAYATNSTGTAYGAVQKFSTPGPVTDIDGNVYQTVNIGDQTWMVGNLKTTKYRTGESISNVTDATAWSKATFGAYCDYNNDNTNGEVYGRLYNWAAVSDSRNICPVGWHIATHAEWTTLVTFLGGESLAAGKLKESGTTHWKTPNTGATNITSFIALPGGKRDQTGAFGSLGDYGYWWTSTENASSTGTIWHWYMSFDNTNAHKDYDTKGFGRSVRCVKD